MKNEGVHQQNRLCLSCQYPQLPISSIGTIENGTNRMLGQCTIAMWSDSLSICYLHFLNVTQNFEKLRK